MLIAALLKRHTTGRARFTQHELAGSPVDDLEFDIESSGDVWAAIAPPIIVDSDLET